MIPNPINAPHDLCEGTAMETPAAKLKRKRKTVLESIASRKNERVVVVVRTRSVAIKYTPKNNDAASAIASPNPRFTCRPRSLHTTTTDPEAASKSPSQKVSRGPRRKIIQLNSPTKIGVLFPNNVAFVAEVCKIAVL